MLYLTRSDVEAAGISMHEIVTALDHMFQEKGKGNAEMPPKPGIHPKADAFIHAMPGYLPGIGAAGMKWVSGYPDNPSSGLPYISGLIILNDPDTGIPMAIMDATWVTAMRTGAATAAAAKYLARAESKTAGIIACGVQGRTNLEALTCLFDLTHVRAFDTSYESALRFAHEMQQELRVEVQVVDTPREAVQGLDLVVTSGPIFKHPTPVIEPGWLAPGAFACPIDFDSYWQGGALHEADKLATDDREQLEYYRSVGYFQSTPVPYADLGEIAAGAQPRRESETERIICLNLGLALEDMATARLIYDRARERGIGTDLPL
jgi:ornithine cyclodeaminase/alanine dehydrogenase